MELLTKPMFGSLKRHWRRRKYHRLNGTKANEKAIKLGGRSHRGWRIKAIPKLHIKITSPLKLLTKLKNAYMNMMLSLAGNVGTLNTSNVFGTRRIPKARQVPESHYSLDEVETRLAYEIYKVLAASRQLTVSS